MIIICTIGGNILYSDELGEANTFISHDMVRMLCSDDSPNKGFTRLRKHHWRMLHVVMIIILPGEKNAFTA